jgi:hypothetical protein
MNGTSGRESTTLAEPKSKGTGKNAGLLAQVVGRQDRNSEMLNGTALNKLISIALLD